MSPIATALATTLPPCRSIARRARRVARSAEALLFQKRTTTTLPASTEASSVRDGSPGAASSARPGLAGLATAAGAAGLAGLAGLAVALGAPGVGGGGRRVAAGAA